MMRKGLIVAVVFVACLAWAGSGSTASAPIAIPELLSAGRVDDALKALDVRLKSSPNDAEAYNLRARSYFALRRWDQAISAGEKAVALSPNTSDYHLLLGRAYGEKADHSNFAVAARLVGKIRQEFERAVELDTSNLNARSDLAEFYLEAPSFMGGGKGKARQQLDAIAKTDSATAHWLRARIAEKEKRYDEAEKEYRAAIQDGNQRGSYWLNLASFYKRMGRLNDMEDAITKAIQSNNKKPNVFVDAAEMLLNAGRNLTGAAQFVRKYLGSGPPVEDAPAFQAHYLLGQILEKQGDKQGAAEEYQAALALANGYDDARDALNRLKR